MHALVSPVCCLDGENPAQVDSSTVQGGRSSTLMPCAPISLSISQRGRERERGRGRCLEGVGPAGSLLGPGVILSPARSLNHFIISFPSLFLFSFHFSPLTVSLSPTGARTQQREVHPGATVWEACKHAMTRTKCCTSTQRSVYHLLMHAAAHPPTNHDRSKSGIRTLIAIPEPCVASSPLKYRNTAQKRNIQPGNTYDYVNQPNA